MNVPQRQPARPPTTLARWAAGTLIAVAALAGLAMSLSRRAVQPASQTSPADPARLNVNTASAAELEMLPGIGPALAKRIVEDREAHGPFRSIDDLDRVPGIGPRTVRNLRRLADTE